MSKAQTTKPTTMKKPAVFKPRIFTKREMAGFLLNDAIDQAGYRRIRRQVEAMGFDPDSIPHDPPSKALEDLWKRGITASYRANLLKTLADGQEAAAYLGAALEDAVHQKDGRLFSIALEDVTEARGKKPSARRATSAGTLELMRLWKALDAIGLRLSIVSGKGGS